mmetsp:Transcript_71263/g.196751  ORF Transcript_71263/g.196751 Transcript_71263/m.196751 type:complete len:274 (+) Transcript_71263:661-1482(+)
MRQKFDTAEATISSAMHGSPLNVVWLDCIDCCSVEDGQAQQVFVWAGRGAPAMLMKEAGLTNVFSDRTGNWVCVNVSDIVAAAPDAIIVVDAAWDKAEEKIKWLYGDSSFCQLEAVRGARFVSIPFSASTLSPRNGPAALDLAIAALHVRLGTLTSTGTSGVSSFNPHTLQVQTKDTLCPLQMEFVVYDDGDSDGDGDGDGDAKETTTEPPQSNALALGLGLGIGIPGAMLALVAGAWLWCRYSQSKGAPSSDTGTPGVVVGQPVDSPAGDKA